MFTLPRDKPWWRGEGEEPDYTSSQLQELRAYDTSTTWHKLHHKNNTGKKKEVQN